MKTVEKYFKASNLIDFVGYNFSDCPNLSDNLIELKLSGKFGIDIERGFVPRYVFDIFLKKERKTLLSLRISEA